MNYPTNYFIVISTEEALLLFQQDKEIFLINSVTNTEAVATSQEEIIAHNEIGLPLGYQRSGKATLEIYNTKTNVVLWCRGFNSENMANFMLNAFNDKFNLSEFEKTFSIRLMVKNKTSKAYRCTRELFTNKLFVSL